MGNKNNKLKSEKINESFHKGENNDFISSINMNNVNITENIIEDYIRLNYDDKPKTKNETMKNLSSINNRNPLKTFENKTNEKSIKFYYNEKLKEIKYKGKFELDSVKKILKSHFLIDEPIDNIFFMDEDEDILILNSNVPDNLTVNLFIRKDFIPKNPTTALKILNKKNSSDKSQKSLLKFHWIMENDKLKKKYGHLCIVDKYIYITARYVDVNPSVSSSSSFTVGKYFFVLRVGTFVCYESLAIIDSDTPDYHKGFYTYKPNTFVGYYYLDHAGIRTATDIAIYIDMDKKKCIFYNYEKKKILLKGRINSDSVKLYAWIKSGTNDITQGMTILNKGCIPIPDWVKP